MSLLAGIRAGKPLKKNEQPPVLPTTPQSYDVKLQKWTAINPDDTKLLPVAPNELVILSFNIRKEVDFLNERMLKLLELIETTEPDFICLQENTKNHMKILKQSGTTLPCSSC